MKILHFVVQYAPQIGGMENAVKELAERAAKKGHDITVVTSSFKGCKKFETKDNLTVYRLWPIRLHGYPFIIPMLPFRLFTLLKRDTVVHVHYMFHYFMDIVLVIAKMKGCRIVTHIHIDLPPSGRFGFLNPPYKRLMWKYILPLSDIIVCPTQDYADLAYRNKMPVSKCVVIPWGVDTTRFKHKDSTKITPPVKVLFVGRLSKEKNIPRLLEAFRLFQAKYDAVLNIVGEGEERPKIEELIRNNSMSNVVMHGALAGQELPDMYAASDIFVLPSNNEAFGIVNLEAMASGLPIVASDVPGLRNLLEGTAVLIKPSAENFTAAMISLVEDARLRNKLISRGLEKVRDYDWARITDKVIDLYEKPVN